MQASFDGSPVKILIVDLLTEQITTRPLDQPLMGGRWLSGQLVSELVDPKVDPLGSGNVLVFACGPLAGIRLSTGGRLSVGAKSPLTQGVKEANSGGMAGDSMALLGYRAIVFTGARPIGKATIFVLDEQGYRFVDAARYLGMGNEEFCKTVEADFGVDYVTVSIGPAGEQRLGAAGIVVSDMNGKPFRIAARGGLGAVMGSKGLKAVLLRRAAKRPPGSDKKETKNATIAFTRLVANNVRVKVLRDYGTASTTMQVQVMGGLCARNFSQGSLENPDAVTGETMRDLILERGGVGKPTESCMDGCVIQCSNIFPGKDGQLAAAPVEFETIGLCGINLGLNDFDQIARINRSCNDLGLDTIEVGAALGVMMEAAERNLASPGFANQNLPHFGDGERAAQVVEEIRTGGRLGKLIGSGVVATGRALGVKRIPAVKGQAMSAYDPRVIKGTGVTYATSPQGADHTAGLTLFAPGDHNDPKKAIKDSRASQIQRAAYDALGLCVFNLGASGAQPQVVLDMLRTHYGVTVPANWLDEVGRRVIALELAFNRAAGLTSADDRLPDFFTQEPIAPTNNVFDVASEDMDNIWTGVLDA